MVSMRILILPRISDWMNQLQDISAAEHGNLFVTMNPPFEPEESKVIARHQYDHAVVDVQVCLDSSRYLVLN